VVGVVVAVVVAGMVAVAVVVAGVVAVVGLGLRRRCEPCGFYFGRGKCFVGRVGWRRSGGRRLRIVEEWVGMVGVVEFDVFAFPVG